MGWCVMEKIDLFECVSPLDYRYFGRNDKLLKEASPFLSEEARIAYQLKVEEALIKALVKKRICSKKTLKEVQKAVKKVKADDVYKEEDRIKHDIRALVNCIRKYVSKDSKQFIHLGLTSNDVINTAESLRFRDASQKLLLPELKKLEKTLIKIALREKKTLQIGRTHGQHAEPITFGFALSEYVHRLGDRIAEIDFTSRNLQGQISGAAGAYNASALIFKDPVAFEKAVLKEVDLEPVLHSTQILPPEKMLDLMHCIVSCFGVLANLADDMRNLQRTELGEVFEFFESKQVGSSTMPHKRNPINFENVKSFWKEFMPRSVSFYLDQISEHQRDLTNSASSRFTAETFLGLLLAVKRLNRSMSKLRVDKVRMLDNFFASSGMISAEPLYILLAFHGHPNAHEVVRKLTLLAEKEDERLIDLALADKSLRKYLQKFSKQQIDLIALPEKYTGLSAKKTEVVCRHWKKQLKV